MIEVLHDVFIGTAYLFGAAAMLALVSVCAAVIAAAVRTMRGRK